MKSNSSTEIYEDNGYLISISETTISMNVMTMIESAVGLVIFRHRVSNRILLRCSFASTTENLIAEEFRSTFRMGQNAFYLLCAAIGIPVQKYEYMSTQSSYGAIFVEIEVGMLLEVYVKVRETCIREQRFSKFAANNLSQKLLQTLQTTHRCASL